VGGGCPTLGLQCIHTDPTGTCTAPLQGQALEWTAPPLPPTDSQIDPDRPRQAHLLQHVVEGREQELLEGVDHGRAGAAHVADEGGHGLKQVVVEARVAWVLAHLVGGSVVAQGAVVSPGRAGACTPGGGTVPWSRMGRQERARVRHVGKCKCTRAGLPGPR